MMKQIDINKLFGHNVTFESVLPLRENTDMEVLDIQDKITDTALLVEIHRLRISPEISRQWLFQARVKHNGKEINIPAYPIGCCGIGSLIDYRIRTATGATIIKFRKWEHRKHLNVLFNYQTFLTLLSQDLTYIAAGDFLILGYETEADYQAMADHLRGRYSTITYWLPQTLENAMIFTTDHTQPYGITDTLPMLQGAFDIGSLWRIYIGKEHPMPRWQTCARCALFGKCKPQRGRWHEVCARHKPIDKDWKPTEKGKQHFLI